MNIFDPDEMLSVVNAPPVPLNVPAMAYNIKDLEKGQQILDARPFSVLALCKTILGVLGGQHIGKGAKIRLQ